MSIAAPRATPDIAPLAQINAPASPQPDTDAPGQASVEAARLVSPVIHVDGDTGIALLVFRDEKTGEQQAQYPSKTAVAAYKHQINLSAASVESPAATGTGAPLDTPAPGTEGAAESAAS